MFGVLYNASILVELWFSTLLLHYRRLLEVSILQLVWSNHVWLLKAGQNKDSWRGNFKWFCAPLCWVSESKMPMGCHPFSFGVWIECECFASGVFLGALGFVDSVRILAKGVVIYRASGLLLTVCWSLRHGIMGQKLTIVEPWLYSRKEGTRIWNIIVHIWSSHPKILWVTRWPPNSAYPTWTSHPVHEDICRSTMLPW